MLDDGLQTEFAESRFLQPTRRNTEFRPISDVRPGEVGYLAVSQVMLFGNVVTLIHAMAEVELNAKSAKSAFVRQRRKTALKSFT